jgi:protein-S-isoprenylcysteine O-methyltransferase Ste14
MLLSRGMNAFDWIELTLLGFFLVIVTLKAMKVRTGRGINPIVLRLANGSLRELAQISFFVCTNVWAILVILHSLGVVNPVLTKLFAVSWTSPIWVRILGFLLSVLAFVLFIMALSALGSSWRLGIDEQEPGDLVTDGIYAHTRNPIYLFFIMWFLGTFLIKGSIVFLILWLFALTNLHYQILHEEAFLQKVHGSTYEEYYSRTPRYFSLSRRFKTERQKPPLTVKAIRE